MLFYTFIQILLVAGASLSVSSPVERRAGSTSANVKCTDPKANIVEHDKNVALLAICGGISGSIQKCGGNPTTTTGASGTAKFTLNAATSGSTINISKGRWEQCLKAARATCPTGAMTGTCTGGATAGNVDFVLAKQ